MHLKALPLVRIALFFSVLTASHAAGIITYTDPAAWLSAVPSALNISFANVAASDAGGSFPSGCTGGADGDCASFVDSTGADRYLIDNVAFWSGTGVMVFTYKNFFSPRYLDCDVACVQDDTESNGSITITHAGMTAIGFYYFWQLTGSATLDVTIGSFVDDTTQSSDDVEFLGFVSSTPFNTITISSNETPNIFDVSIGSGSEAPEPGASALAVLGLATFGLYFVQRRRIRHRR